jgi:hypothetical protein
MSLEAILKEYNDNSKSTGGGSQKTFDLAKYFSTFLPKGVDEAIKQVRLLPGKDGNTPFTTIHVHTKKVEGQWRKFVCPKEEKGEDCPFCASYDLIQKEGTDEQKKTSYVFKPRKAYVIKLIDRAKEAEGPKFWRINHNAKKAGYYDKIISLFKLYEADLSNAENGRDLAISIERNADDVPTVTNIIAREPSPLHSDTDTANKWLNDGDTWEDVYAIKSYDYLKIIVTDGEPVWDKEAKTYVDKKKANEKPKQDYNSDLESELTMSGAATTTTEVSVEPTTTATPTSETPTTPTTPTAETDDDDFDDLPF